MEARYLENDIGRPAIVTNFKDGAPVGMVNLNDFVFGTNPRYFSLYFTTWIYIPYGALKQCTHDILLALS